MKILKNIMIIVVLIIFVLCFAVGAGAKAFSVALIIPSQINDLSWSQSIYDSLVRIQEEMGKDEFQFVYSENMWVVEDAAVAIRDYASEGYNMVIAHGSQYEASLADIAPDFPNTSFVCQSYTADYDIPNKFTYEAAEEESGYIQGVLASKLTESNVIGVVGPINSGDGKRVTSGFIQGVQATKPDVKVNVVWTGSFGDMTLAAEAAQAHIDAGADILMGTASQCMVGSIGVAKSNEVLWFGHGVDDSSLAPQVVVCNVILDWSVALKPMIELIKEGELGGKIFTINLANNGLNMILHQEALLGNAIKDIVEGKVKVDKGL